MRWFYHFWLPFVYKAISCHFWSNFGQFWCQIFPKLSEIKPLYLWVLSAEGYVLWVIVVVWVMSHFSLRTNLVDWKPMGLKGVWGNWAMGYEGVNCIENFLDAHHCGGGYQYLVRWCGFGHEHNEWLPGSELGDWEALDIWLASLNGSPWKILSRFYFVLASQ